MDTFKRDRKVGEKLEVEQNRRRTDENRRTFDCS